jgi:hypothetical protein
LNVASERPLMSPSRGQGVAGCRLGCRSSSAGSDSRGHCLSHPRGAHVRPDRADLPSQSRREGASGGSRCRRANAEETPYVARALRAGEGKSDTSCRTMRRHSPPRATRFVAREVRDGSRGDRRRPMERHASCSRRHRAPSGATCPAERPARGAGRADQGPHPPARRDGRAFRACLLRRADPSTGLPRESGDVVQVGREAAPWPRLSSLARLV